MDLDPFEPVGISAHTARFLDIFLLHCLLERKPARHAGGDRRAGAQPASHRDPRPRARPAARAQQPAPAAGRLGRRTDGRISSDRRGARRASLAASAYQEALDTARAVRVRDPERLPSARVLAAIAATPDGSHNSFTDRRSAATREILLALPWSAEQQQRHRRAGRAVDRRPAAARGDGQHAVRDLSAGISGAAPARTPETAA